METGTLQAMRWGDPPPFNRKFFAVAYAAVGVAALILCVCSFVSAYRVLKD